MLSVRPPVPAPLFDAGRWLLEESLRQSLPPENPEILRFCSGSTWRGSCWLKPARRAVMVDEIRRSFGMNLRTAESIAREAHDITLQARLEGLLAPRIADFSPYLRIFGEIPAGSLVLHPSASGATLVHAALARRYPGLVIFRARGLPPRGGVGPLRDSVLNRLTARRRMQEESLLPIQWEDDPTTLERHLRNGARVLAAFDDRAFQRWTPLRLLGRPATLSEDPWIAARNADTPVIPCFFLRERDKTWRVDLGAPYRGTLPDWLRLQAEPWLQRHPGAYAMWLAECRIRKKMDDHPFFLDYPGSATGLD